jgi:hypothetical protein
MQTDVLSAHLNSSGFAVLGRYRLKSFLYVASATAGTINIYDTTVAPVAATTGYAQSTYTVTVTSSAHGLKVGQQVGITFGSVTGVSATNGNYVVATVADANTFTVTDINSRTITGGACTFTTGRWLTSVDTAALTTSGVPQNQNVLIPGEGVIAYNAMYILMTNQTGVTIFYG